MVAYPAVNANRPTSLTLDHLAVIRPTLCLHLEPSQKVDHLVAVPDIEPEDGLCLTVLLDLTEEGMCIHAGAVAAAWHC
jgi:hypothetical protein